MDGVSFGDFSVKEVTDLYTQTTGGLEFVWQKTPAPAVAQEVGQKSHLTTQRAELGGLSPNIPPNPPTSPIEGLLDHCKSPPQLNINAMPFEPENVIAPHKNSTAIRCPTSRRDTAINQFDGTHTNRTEIFVSDQDSEYYHQSGDSVHIRHQSAQLRLAADEPPYFEGVLCSSLTSGNIADNPQPLTQHDQDSTLFFSPAPTPPHPSQLSQPHTSTSTSTLDSVPPTSQSPPPLAMDITPIKPQTRAWGNKNKSWASIVGKQPTPIITTPPGSLSQSSKVSLDTSPQDTSVMDEQTRQSQLRELGEQLSKLRLSHQAVSILPRGLVNQGNWCYMHAPLQALLACPEFLSVFRSLSNSFPALSRQPGPAPITDTMIQFVGEFKPYPKTTPVPVAQPDPKSKRKKSGQREFHHGDPFRPQCVYDMLQKIKSSLSFKGRQEDAEEFLGQLLNGLHEEMVSAQQAVLSNQEPPSDSETALSTSTSEAGDVGDTGEGVEGVEWEQVGRKNKSAITRQTTLQSSLITKIFGGELRSSVHRQKVKESATLQPFFSLQLDIQSEGVWTVKDALEALSAKETVHISESEAYKRLTLAKLPPVLVLHLKRFVFNKTGGSQKLLKQVQYSTEMEIGKDLLSPSIRSKLSQNQRSYRLWAVVYHHGKTAAGGHYTCDTHHPACGGWVRADDSALKAIPEEFVLKPPASHANKVAYILFYRRLDSIRT